MTNLDLYTELRSMLEGIIAETSRGLSLAELPPPPNKEDCESIRREFDVIRARVWADVCRGICLAGEVEIHTGLTDENHRLIEEIREIHDSLMAEGWENV